MTDLKQFLSEGRFQAVVMGDGSAFSLIFLADPITPELLADITERRFGYCGTLAMKNGEPRCFFAGDDVHPLQLSTMLAAAPTYVPAVQARIAWSGLDDLRTKLIDDSWTAELERLFALPDPRTEN